AHARDARRARDDGAVPAAPRLVDDGAVTAAARLVGDGAVTEVEAKAILAEAGVPVVEERVVTCAEDAAAAAQAADGPVVLKVVSPDIPHKTEVGGVALGIRGGAAAAEAYTCISASARAARPGARV